MSTPALQFSHVTKVYPHPTQPVQALHDLSFSLASGQTMLLMGRSGSGKTTVLNLAAGLDQPTNGEIHIAGQNITHATESFRRRIRRTNIGFASPDLQLIPYLSIRKNLYLQQNIAEVIGPPPFTIDQLLELAGISHLQHKRADRLSAGEHLRATIIRAVIHNPAVVLLDEPTANLDSHNTKNILELIQQIHRHTPTAFLIATHDPDLQAIAHQTIHLVDGRQA